MAGPTSIAGFWGYGSGWHGGWTYKHRRFLGFESGIMAGPTSIAGIEF